MTVERVVQNTAGAVREAVGEQFVAYRHFYGRDGDDRAREFFAQRLALADSFVWSALDDAAGVLGFVQVYADHSSLALRTVWWLNDLFVDPERRAGGVGRALVGHVLSQAAEHGVASVRLETKASNAAARALYEQTGFVLDGEQVPAPAASEFVTYACDRPVSE